MATLYSLESALAYAAYWRREPHPDTGATQYGVIDRIAENTPTITAFTQEELAAVDARLVDVFDDLFIGDGDIVCGSDIYKTLQFWDRQSLPVTPITLPRAAQRGADLSLPDFELGFVHQFEHRANYVWLAHEVNRVSTTRNGTVYSTASDFHGVDVDAAWLDANYPGWTARMELAKQLGLPASEFIHYVLVKNIEHSEAPSLPDTGLTI